MIRKLTERDKTLYMALTEEFYNSDAVLQPVAQKNREACFKELMRSSDYAEAFIIEKDGEAAGYGLLAKTFSQEAGGITVWLEELFILEKFRGGGLATEFFNYVEKNVPARRYRLETEPDNFRARELYKRMGFKPLEYLQMIKDI